MRLFIVFGVLATFTSASDYFTKSESTVTSLEDRNKKPNSQDMLNQRIVNQSAKSDTPNDKVIIDPTRNLDGERLEFWLNSSIVKQNPFDDIFPDPVSQPSSNSFDDIYGPDVQREYKGSVGILENVAKKFAKNNNIGYIVSLVFS